MVAVTSDPPQPLCAGPWRKVVATNGYLSKTISVMPVGVGFMAAALTPRKQALHDMLSETLVRERSHT